MSDLYPHLTKLAQLADRGRKRYHEIPEPLAHETSYDFRISSWTKRDPEIFVLEHWQFKMGQLANNRWRNPQNNGWQPVGAYLSHEDALDALREYATMIGYKLFDMIPEYRYILRRNLLGAGMLPLFPRRILWCALNPSTAEEREGGANDPSVRRMMGFSRQLDGTDMHLVNMYAARTTDPYYLWTFDDPIGPENDYWIDREASKADIVIAAWGAEPKAVKRAADVLHILHSHGPVYHLGDLTKNGQPRHPLYLPSYMKLNIL